VNPTLVLVCACVAAPAGLVLMWLHKTVESRYRRTVAPVLDGSHDLLTIPLTLKEWEALAALDFTSEGAS
jgi:hypothetical protein